MLKIGSHVSISNGLLGAAKEAQSYGANTFMLYTGAPQNTIRKPIDALKLVEGKEFMSKNGLIDFVVHAPYIINLASYKPEIFELAKRFLGEEISRTASMGSDYLILHPGSYTDMDLEYGINRIVEGLNEVINNDTVPTILLETMAGKGSEVGYRFEHIAEIISKVNFPNKIGVCMDTCHIHDAGYDIVNDLDSVLSEFDTIIGLDKLKVVHINGSLNKLGAKKDRHANIGASSDNPKGADYIGAEVIFRIVHHPLIANRHFILETPWLDKKTNLYKEEIAMIRG
ncbi:MAG: apurinic endonuclease Apn1 [Clostridiales bacterium]|jgi:deoxyribonuclease-4|nr:apurinic endonuclease Apn1 [Clostridiales bacterium]